MTLITIEHKTVVVTPQKFKFDKKTRNFEVQYLPHITVDLSNKNLFELQQNIGELQDTLYDLMLQNREILKTVQTVLEKIMPGAHVRIRIFASRSVTKEYLLEL